MIDDPVDHGLVSDGPVADLPLPFIKGEVLQGQERPDHILLSYS
jgi:hypothetical protein